MDTNYDSHLDLDDRRDELRPTLRLQPTTSTPSFNRSFLFQHNTSTATTFPHSNVQTLLLRNNQLTTMSPYANALYEMHHSLRELTLRNNAFTKFPVEILVLINLTSLSLAKNQIQYIGLNLFPQLPHLTWLSLSHNHLGSLPDDLASCPHLLGLDLSSNNFQKLPRVISQLNQLQVLLVQKNELYQLLENPDEPLPTSLQTLNLAFNRFDGIPDILVTKPPPDLTHLHLSGNPLGELPPDFLKYGYKNLVSLDLHTCHLSRVSPHFFTYLDQTHSNTNSKIPLRRLNLAINQLRELPNTIGLTTELQWLNLNDNRLTTLPPTMSHLVHLAKLGLVQNRIQYIPPHLFSRMLALEKIDLRRNQLSYLPPSILLLAPEHEIQQHIDLAVPITVFEANRVNQVCGNDQKMSNEGEPGTGGGSLKTLLLYENIYLEQKDGIFVALEDDEKEDDEEEKEKEPKIWAPMISLEKLKSFSNTATKNASILGNRLQCAWKMDLNTDACDDEMIRFFFRHFPSLKNIALEHHLAQQQQQQQQQSHINIYNNSRNTTTSSTLSVCQYTKSTASTHHRDRLDVQLETRHAFLSQAFPEWFPCLLQQNILSDAQQCDNCKRWSTVFPFQVGYLARLCNNRMQVPVRYTVCSAWCALDATIRIQTTAENWRIKRLDSAIHLSIPTTATTTTTTITSDNNNDYSTTLGNNDSTTFTTPRSNNYYHNATPEQHSINENTNDLIQHNQLNTTTSTSTSTLSSSSKDRPDETTSTISSLPQSSSTGHNHKQREEGANSIGPEMNDQENASMHTLTRALRRVEQLAASLIHCATPQSQQQQHQQQQHQHQQQQQRHQTFSSTTTSSHRSNINTLPPSSLTPLHRPIYPTTSTMIQRLSQLPIPPALSQNDTLRLTDPRPTLTSFNHLPRDAIRLERF